MSKKDRMLALELALATWRGIAESNARGNADACKAAYNLTEEVRMQKAKQESLAEELHRMQKEVGSLGGNDHPDELKPRAETWLQERKNWAAQTRKLVEQLAATERRLEQLRKLKSEELHPDPVPGYVLVSVFEELPPMDEFVATLDAKGNMIIYRRVSCESAPSGWFWNMRDSIALNTPKDNEIISHWLKRVMVTNYSK